MRADLGVVGGSVMCVYVYVCVCVCVCVYVCVYKSLILMIRNNKDLHVELDLTEY